MFGGGVTGVASVSQRACFVRDVVGVCKLFQTETTCALLGKIGSAEPAGVRYLGIISNPARVGLVGGVVHGEGDQACVGEGDGARHL